MIGLRVAKSYIIVNFEKQEERFCFPIGDLAKSWALPWSRVEGDEWKGRGSEGKRGLTQLP